MMEADVESGAPSKCFRSGLARFFACQPGFQRFHVRLNSAVGKTDGFVERIVAGFAVFALKIGAEKLHGADHGRDFPANLLRNGGEKNKVVKCADLF